MADDLRAGRGTIRLTRGDITLLEVDAVVFYARPDLQLGSGYGTAISVRGGPAVQADLKKVATPVATTEAVITTGGNLKARHVLHVVGPRFQEEGSEAKLRASVVNVLALADRHGLKRVALPAMGAGFYGVPLDLCARVMLRAIRAHLAGGSGIEEAVVCLLDGRETRAFQAEMARIAGEAGSEAAPAAADPRALAAGGRS